MNATKSSPSSWRVAWVVKIRTAGASHAAADKVIALLPRRLGVIGVESALVALCQVMPEATAATMQVAAADELRHGLAWNYHHRHAQLMTSAGSQISATRSRIRLLKDGRLEIKPEPQPPDRRAAEPADPPVPPF